jgi:DNA-binding LacI/PurR family transcriptional regulator
VSDIFPTKLTQRASISADSANRKNQAEAAIKTYIQLHELQPDEKLPSIRALSDHLQISRDSAWRALKDLQETGWVKSLANRRYAVADGFYNNNLRSLRIRALFTGDRFIQFGGFRRFADTLGRLCRFNNLPLMTTLVPFGETIDATVWDSCDVLLVDSDTSVQLLAQFEDFPVPVIGLDAAYSDRYHTNFVTDHTAGGGLVAEYLIQQGAKSVCIPYPRASLKNPRVKARIDGFTQTWQESGLSVESILTASIPWSANNFQLSINVKAYLEKAERFSHYFVADGRLAVSFLEVLEFISVPVPKKVRVIGYDGAQVGQMTSPPMTTIQQHMEQMAEEVVELIMGSNGVLSADPAGRIIRLKPHLVERSSA